MLRRKSIKRERTGGGGRERERKKEKKREKPTDERSTDDSRSIRCLSLREVSRRCALTSSAVTF